MADLYSVIPGIQPDQQDIVEAELLAKQILEAKYPDLDLREGTGIRDLVLRPSAFLLALCKKGFDYYFSQNTLDKVDDTSPTELVDDLLSNLFLTRNTGSFAVINVRLYFARQKSVALNTNVSFSTDGQLLFFPTLTTTYPSGALQFDSFQNEWFIDVDLIAGEKGTNYNISSGSLLYFSNFDPYFLHGEINYLSQSSTAPETNTEFISRAQSSISTRNLINNPSITSQLKNTFNFVNKVKNVGAGDPEIYRDQVQVLGGPSVTRSATSMTLTDSDTRMLVNLTSHGFVVGQLVDVVESGTSPTKLILRSTPVMTVVDANNFKVDVIYSVAPRTFLFPYVTPINGSVYVHQGGMVDIHCSEDVSSSLLKITTDINGKAIVEGPIYSLVRSSIPDGDPDDITYGTSHTISFLGQVVETAVSFTQAGDGTITVNWARHPMQIGRMIKIYGWPTGSSTSYQTVTSIVDSNNFKVGRGLPTYSVSGVTSPYVTYVHPTKDTGFSTRQQLVVDFGGSYASQTATFISNKFQYIDSIQSFLDLSENRVLCADYMARGFDIYILDIDLVVYDDALPSSGFAASIIKDFLKTLAPGQDFILSDLVAVLTSTGGISKLKTPLTVNYRYFNKDLFGVHTGTVVDALVPDNTTSVFIPGVITTALGTI